MKKFDLKKAGRVTRLLLFVFVLLVTEVVLFQLICEKNKYDVLTYVREKEEEALSLRIEELKQCKDEKQMVEYLEENIKSAGSRYAYLVEDGTVIFAKSALATEKLQDLTEYSMFLKSLKGQDVMLLGQTIERKDHMYVIGLVISNAAILEEVGFAEQSIYLRLFFGATFLLLIILTLRYAGKYEKAHRLWKQTDDQLVKRNEMLELTVREEQKLKESDQIKAEVPKEIWKADDMPVFDRRIAESLLKKADMVSMYPFGFLFVKVQMGDKYYTKKEMTELAKLIGENLGKTQLLFEVGKGKFVLVLFRAGMEKVQEMKADLLLRLEKKNAMSSKEDCMQVEVICKETALGMKKPLDVFLLGVDAMNEE